MSVKGSPILLSALIILSISLVSVPTDAEQEFVHLDLYDQDGHIYEGKLMDGTAVGVQTETFSDRTVYRIIQGTEIPLKVPVHIRITSDIRSGFSLSLTPQGIEGTWMADTGLQCILTDDHGVQVASASVSRDGGTALFRTAGEISSLSKDTDYHLGFAVSGTVEYDLPPSPITNIQLTYEAISNVESHFVYFDYDGGTGTETSREVITGKPIGTLPQTQRDGYRFGGWFVGEERITDNTLMGHSDMHAKALWLKTHYLEFDANGGMVSPSSKELVEGESYGPLPTPVRKGYGFDGWFTSSSGGEPVSPSDVMGTRDVTVYAHWTESKEVVVEEHTYIDEDGNTVYERDTSTYYPDGTNVLEKYITVTDPQGRLISQTTRTETTGPDGSVTLRYRTMETQYSESGRTMTVTENDSDPSGYGYSSKTVTSYDPQGAIISVSSESKEHGKDAYGNDYTESSTIQSDSDDILDYTYDRSGTLYPSDRDVDVTVRYGTSGSEAVVKVDASAITAGMASTVSELMERATEPIPVRLSPILDLVSDKASVSSDALSILAEGGFGLRIGGDIGDLEIDPDCMRQAEASGLDLFLSIERGTEDNLNEKQLIAVGDGFAVVVTMLYGDTPIHEIGGTASIRIVPGYDSDDLTLWYVDDVGAMEQIGMEYDPDTGIVLFQVDHFSVYLVTFDTYSDLESLLLISIISILVLIILAIFLWKRRTSKEEADDRMEEE